MSFDYDLEIKPITYEWSVRLFTIVKKLLRVNVKMHHDEGQLEQGDIFLFNHFSRFETFIPQYLIYRETGVYCRSVADKELFVEDDTFSNYLLSLGAVPNDYDRLLPFLAEEILRGRKVIVFPEGGMVKDRLVQDGSGRYRVYSRSALTWRTHHRGAAVLASLLDVFKMMVRDAYAAGQMRRLRNWAGALGLQGVETLLLAATKPTLIVPANITFYPIRVNDNILRKGAEIVNKGLSRRASEELLIEGNILLKDTDMDIRLGAAISVSGGWHWWQRRLIERVGRSVDGLEQLFALKSREVSFNTRLLTRAMNRRAELIRDEFMHRIYQGVTVNLSHLAASVIMSLVRRGVTEIQEHEFLRAIYLVVKYVQREPTVHLHRSLRNPEWYQGILVGHCDGLQQFLATAASMELLRLRDGCYHLLPKLLDQHPLDTIRLRNLVAVYHNETRPVAVIDRCVERALDAVAKTDNRALAMMRFDDTVVAYRWDRQYFLKSCYREINRLETATESGKPFLLLPEHRVDSGVVLVHGFLASPAELYRFGQRMATLGYGAIGVRLKGHGTSPWDLRERQWQDWLACVREGYAIMAALVERVGVVGFSVGGTLALKLASEQPDKLMGVASVAAPLKFVNRNMRYVSLVHGANEFVRLVSPMQGVIPFRPNEPENPHINYRSIPMRGLHELRRLVEEAGSALADVHCPVAVIQGTRDPVVDPHSAKMIYDGLGGSRKTLTMVSSDRHAILYDNIGHTQEAVLAFFEALAADTPPRHPPKMQPVAVSARSRTSQPGLYWSRQ